MKGILSILINLHIILVLLHAIGSWIPQIRESRFYEKLDSLISPILNPIRKVVPPVGGFDFSPLVFLFILYLIKYLLRL